MFLDKLVSTRKISEYVTLKRGKKKKKKKKMERQDQEWRRGESTVKRISERRLGGAQSS